MAADYSILTPAPSSFRGSAFNSPSTVPRTLPLRECDDGPAGLTAKGRQRVKRVRTVTGCVVCRQRRVKCDERRPRCTNCSRHPNRVCEYQFAPITPGRGSSDTMVLSSASTSAGTPSTSALPLSPDPPIADEPYLPSAYRDIVVERTLAGMIAAEGRGFEILNPTGGPSSLADALLSKLAYQLGPTNSFDPRSPTAPLRTLLAYHETIVRRSFTDLDDRESRLLCSTTALFATGSVTNRDELTDNYLGLVRNKSAAAAAAAGMAVPRASRGGNGFGGYGNNEPVTGKLGAVGFTLFLSQVLAPAPGRWKEQLRAGVEWAVARGGPGWVIGVSPPLPGHRGGDLRNVQPIAMALYSDFTALLVMFASLTEGTLPIFINYNDVSWILASRALQLKCAPGMPDLFEALLAAPRIIVPTFATAVGLVSRRLAVDPQAEMVKEQLDHEVSSLRTELEVVWPPRLAGRQDSRRLQYGGRLWRLAVLILVIHKAQEFPPTSPELIMHVAQFIELCSEAASDIGHLSGWLWPILMVGCAACLQDHRTAIFGMLPLARSCVGEKDCSDEAGRILSLVHLHHDIGDHMYHIRDAVKDDPMLDVLLV